MRQLANDVSQGQLRRARKKPYATEVSFFVMDTSAAALAEYTFDKIFIPRALHEMLRQLRLAVLRAARRLLLPGGTGAGRTKPLQPTRTKRRG